jgi:hypothetical protein
MSLCNSHNGNALEIQGFPKAMAIGLLPSRADSKLVLGPVLINQRRLLCPELVRVLVD